MANASQGVTVTWAGVTLAEVVSISVDGVSAETVDVTPRTSLDRFKVYSAADNDYGTINVTCRGTAAMTSTNVGLTGALSITAPGAGWSFAKAIFEKIGWAASVGELQSYSVTFKVGA